LPEFATQMLVPSNAIAFGLVPTAVVVTRAPVAMFSFFTLLLVEFANQMLAPSYTMPFGTVVPAGAKFVAAVFVPPYQWSVATCFEFSPLVTTPPAPAALLAA